MQTKKLLLLPLTFILLLGIATAAQMGLSGTVLDNSGNPITGNLRIYIYDSAAAGNLIYDSTTTFNGKIDNGSYAIMLGATGPTLDLVFGGEYYMDMTVVDDDMNFDGADRKKFISTVGNITTLNNTVSVSDLTVTTNLTAPVMCLNGICRTQWTSVIGLYLTDTAGNVSFDTALLNATIDARRDGTGINATGDSYFFSLSGILYMNETTLNATIDARPGGSADGTGINASSGDYLSDSSGIISFNETLLNATIDARSAASNGKAGVGYLYNISGNMYLNETTLNATIDDRANGSNDGVGLNFTTGPYLNDDGSTINFNETKLNNTITDLAGGNDGTGLNATGDSYFFSLSGILYMNETTLNATIDARPGGSADGTGINTSTGPYLSDSSGIIYFNESKLNVTISAIASNDGTGGWTNTSINTTTDLDIFTTGNLSVTNYGFFGWLGNIAQQITELFAQTIHVSSTLNVTGDLYLNGSLIDDWNDISGSSDGTGINTTNSYYLSDSSGIIYFNESKLNTTIDARFGSDETGGWTNTSINTTTSLVVGALGNLSVGNYLILNGIGINNWSDVNGSASADGTGINASTGPYLSDSSGIVSFNETRLNATIDDRATGVTDGIGLNFTVGSYLNDNGSSIFFNESKLNTTIDARLGSDETGGWINSSTITNTSLSIGVAGNVTINDLLIIIPKTIIPSCSDSGAILMYNASSTVLPCYCDGSSWKYFINNSVCS